MLQSTWLALWAWLICLLVIVHDVACLPLGSPFPAASAVVPAATHRQTDIPPWVLVKLGASPLPRLVHNPWWSPQPRHRHTGVQVNLPKWHSGPWDTAWSLWSDASRHFFGVGGHTLTKRTLGRSVEEMIANHLRPTDKLQRAKDALRRLFGLKLKVTPQQYRNVVNKYRPTAGAATNHPYRSGTRTTFTPRRPTASRW